MRVTNYKAVIGFMIGALYTFLSDGARAEGCSNGTIQSVSSDGLVIVLDDGAVYRIGSEDQATSVLWEPFDNVEVCDGMMIDDDRDEEKVKATPRN